MMKSNNKLSVALELVRNAKIKHKKGPHFDCVVIPSILTSLVIRRHYTFLEPLPNIFDYIQLHKYN